MNTTSSSTGKPKSMNGSRYFFNIRNGGTAPLPQCFDLSSIQEVRREVVKLACAAIGDDPDEFWHTREWQLTVTNESGLNLLTLLVLATDAPVARSQ